MAYTVSNGKELEALLMPKLKEACEYVAKKIYETNHEVVEEVVYGAYTPSVYERTRELIRAWDDTEEIYDNEVYMDFSYQADQTTATSVVTGETVRNLAEIVYEGLAGPIFGRGPWTKRRDAWSALLNKVGSRQMKTWFTEGLRKAGLDFRSHTFSILG